MADRKKFMISLGLTIALAALNLVAMNYLLAGWSTARLDLTADGRYSISPATERILKNLDEELTIFGYFSERTHPKLAPLIPELTDLLEEYRAVSRDKVHVEIIDPGEDEAAEEEASERYGVRSAPFRLASKHESAIVNAYFALVVKYGDQYVRYGFMELIAVEATPDGDIDVRLRNPEYDLTRAIKKVVYGFRSTHELFERVDDPVKLTVIWTPSSLPELFSETPEKVRNAARELGESGGEMFAFEEIDPTGSETVRNDVYQRWGARPMSLGLFSDEEFYLYGILENSGRVEQIVLTEESLTTASVREAIENSLKRSTPGYLKTVGVVTSDPPEIPPQIRMQMQMPPQPPPEYQQVKRLLREEYQVTEVDLDAGGGVPSDVDILLVLKPRDLSEIQLYSLDQYLMRGGRVVICAGNYNIEFAQTGLSLTSITTGLDDWLQHFGIGVEQTLVLDDRNQALPIPEVRQTPFGSIQEWVLAPYPYLLQVRDDGFRRPEITAGLDAVGIYWGSPLTVDEAATGGLEVVPILQSSEASWTDDDTRRVGFIDYEVPAEGTEPYLLAAAVSGKFKSYFAGKPIPARPVATPAEPPVGEAASPEPAPVAAVTLEESPETRLIVVGNAEFLSDLVAQALGQTGGGFFDENLRFAQNLIDWVSLDNEMLSIRARGSISRRLARTERSTQTAIEWVNYLVPILLLAFVGFYLHWKRRQVLPVTTGPDARYASGRSKP
jgi:ABC-2 type transport system permease protein